MNLVLSGPIDVTLRNLVVALSKPLRVVPLHVTADRLERVDDADAVRAAVAALCDAARVDHAYIEEGVRFADFKLLAMDMDSTLITIECIDEIADFAGKKNEVAAITEAAMRGEMDFEASLRQRVALLAGMHVNVLAEVFEERLALTAGARDLISLAKSAGMRTILVSGGFSYFTQRLKKDLSFDEAYGNELEISDELLTGKLLNKLIDADCKAQVVKCAVEKFGYSYNQVIVIGDGSNDIKMMNAVNFSVAFHATPNTRAAATFHIDYGSLSTIRDWL